MSVCLNGGNTYCKNSAVEGKKLCQMHLEKDAARCIENRAKRVALGLCKYGDCPNPIVKGKQSCDEHLARMRKWSRVGVHSFDKNDEARFLVAIHCDWCGLPFGDEKTYIDHDRRCCDDQAHCWFCTRGFIHNICNSHGVTWFEWYESKTGIELPMLADYRRRFPVPRIPV